MITLKNLSEATAQQVFDQVVAHLLTQNAKAETVIDTEADGDAIAQCEYRNSNGLRCAAGCLIGEDEYKLEFEGKSWLGLISAGVAPKKHSDLITELQWVHDTSRVEKWKEKLQVLSENFGLDMPEGF